MKKYFSSITKFKYDLFVIGGGSGGIAAANQASQFNKKIGLCDFVDPSPIGTKWGLGGTCVNVGCIPKKLFHGASLKMEDLDTYKHIGLNINYEKNLITKNNTNYFNSDLDISEIQSNENKEYSHPKIDWNKLSSTIQMYVKKQNFGNRSKLRKNNIDYFNKKAKFIDNHTIELTDNKGKEIITADKILISVGGRPSYGNFAGNKCVITSDDIFSLKKNLVKH